MIKGPSLLSIVKLKKMKRRVKGEVQPKMIPSFLVVFGALSQMVKVRGAHGKPFGL